MKGVNKFSKKSDYLRTKSTKKYSTLAQHGFGAPLGIISDKNMHFKLVAVNDKLMLESRTTGERFPYTETIFPKKKLKEKEIEKQPSTYTLGQCPTFAWNSGKN